MTDKSKKEYDVLVIGGGIYGVMFALEAARENRRVMLFERADWGSGSTENWLRILHGGLRYLQTADLPRFFESVRERSWFLEHFPEYTRPVRCVMPLYRRGSRSRLIMRTALLVNDVLSVHRNRRLADTNRLPGGSVISAKEVSGLLPYVDTDGLVGGALWYDAMVIEPQLLLMQLLDWCKHYNVEMRNYAEVVEIETGEGAVSGVHAVLRNSSDRQFFGAPVVINAAGHAVPKIAEQAGSAIPVVPANSWAWNVLFDIPFAGDCAAAVHERRKDAQVFFVVPWQGRMLAGTGHAPIASGDRARGVPADFMRRFVRDLHNAAPGLGVSMQKVARVFAGNLPVEQHNPEELTSRPIIVDHSHLGLSGLYSVWGIKYTTVRAVVRRTLKQVLGTSRVQKTSFRDLPRANYLSNSLRFHDTGSGSGPWSDSQLKEIASLAAVTDVHHLDDLLLRRCGVGDLPVTALGVSDTVANELRWDEERKNREIERLRNVLNDHSASHAGLVVEPSQN